MSVDVATVHGSGASLRSTYVSWGQKNWLQHDAVLVFTTLDFVGHCGLSLLDAYHDLRSIRLVCWISDLNSVWILLLYLQSFLFC